MPLSLRILRLRSDAVVPSYATAGAAGFDLSAAIVDPVIIPPGERAKIGTGLSIGLPADHEMQIRPRSGLADRSGIMVVNSPGTIDEDFRGEVMVLLLNVGQEPFEVTSGMRIAQGVVAPVTRVSFEVVERLDETGRAGGGFGSTGTGVL